jgi:hypothetical protein
MIKPKQPSFFIDRRVPVALMVTVLLQAGAVVWWASMTEAQDRFRDVRIHELEVHATHEVDRQEHILERLVRLEARSDTQLDILQQILQRLDMQTARKK